MHAPPLPVGRLGLEHVAGWHLWVHMRPALSWTGLGAQRRRRRET